ncbi:MAG TPA: four helix bundle protein [Gemmatimonadaceae bacterium]|nr:four helix bundle protein [Gemmatimonadaceae bacterium]
MRDSHALRPEASSYRELDVWQAAMLLVVDVYQVSAMFPTDERFGLTTQVRRAAVSIAANIAEGKARYGAAECRRFVSIACGSRAELETELEIAERLGYAATEQLAVARARAESVGAC